MWGYGAGGARPAGRSRDGGLQARRAGSRHREPRANPRDSHNHSACRMRAREPDCPPERPSRQCPPTFLRGRIRALTPRACLLPPLASPPGQGTPPSLSARTKSGGGESSPPPPRAVTPWCRPSCDRPVCVCASDARSDRRRRRSCSLCGSRSCPGPRCGRCRRIRA